MKATTMKNTKTLLLVAFLLLLTRVVQRIQAQDASAPCGQCDCSGKEINVNKNETSISGSSISLDSKGVCKQPDSIDANSCVEVENEVDCYDTCQHLGNTTGLPSEAIVSKCDGKAVGPTLAPTTAPAATTAPAPEPSTTPAPSAATATTRASIGKIIWMMTSISIVVAFINHF